jgi:hypothetical protein
VPTVGFRVGVRAGLGNWGSGSRGEGGVGGFIEAEGCGAANGAGIRNLNFGSRCHAVPWGTYGGDRG